MRATPRTLGAVALLALLAWCQYGPALATAVAHAAADAATTATPHAPRSTSSLLRTQLRKDQATGSKIMVGYFYNLYAYDPHGGRQPLPPNVTSPVELLEQELGPLLPSYDVVIQAFIDPADFNGTAINSPHLDMWRDGVNGSVGLKALCAKHNIPLMVSIGGGGAAKFVSDSAGPLIDALYSYVTAHGYAGIDVDEENTVDVGTYVGFLESLSSKFKGQHVAAQGQTGDADGALLVSCTIGPMSCCFQSRGICRAAPDIDWAFLMLYDGLVDSSAFDLPPGSSSALWQAPGGQTFCGIKPQGPQQHGIVGNVASGGCQFANFALYLNWPADKLIFGMPLYSNGVSWAMAMAGGYKAGTSKPAELLTEYSGASGGALTFMSPSDAATRTQYVLDKTKSKLGVTLDNSGWQSRISQCGGPFNKNSTFVGATLRGVGTWEMSQEDAAHHEVSDAMAAVVKALNVNER